MGCATRATLVIALGIDTATRLASVGVLCDGDVVSERSLPSARLLGATTVPLVGEVLSECGRRASQIDLVAVSAGPGSFTGLRVGLSIAKGIALSTGCAVVAVPTLEALAQVAADLPAAVGRLICPVLDARKGEVYTALYRAAAGEHLRCELAERACPPAALVREIAGPCILIGDGVAAYEEVWQRHLGERGELLSFADHHPRGAVVAALGARVHAERGGDDVASLVPRYCRAAEAQVAEKLP